MINRLPGNKRAERSAAPSPLFFRLDFLSRVPSRPSFMALHETAHSLGGMEAGEGSGRASPGSFCVFMTDASTVAALGGGVLFLSFFFFFFVKRVKPRG